MFQGKKNRSWQDWTSFVLSPPSLSIQEVDWQTIDGLIKTENNWAQAILYHSKSEALKSLEKINSWHILLWNILYSVRIFVCLPVFPAVCQSVSLFVCMSVCLCVCLSAILCTCLCTVYVSVHDAFVSSSTHMCIVVYVHVSASAYMLIMF